MAFERRHGEFLVSDDRSKIDVEAVHEFLSRSYWAEGIPREVLERAIANSICFGVYGRERQVGFARAITDRATYAYLADVFILESHRGRGLARFLMSAIAEHPELQGLRRQGLVTRDAHGLYEKFGFRPLANPSRHMEIHDPVVYRKRR